MKLIDYREYPKICCIYEIHNIITAKKYIGSTINLNDRIRRHLWYLKNNLHHSPKLQNSFNLHGIDNFEVNILLILNNTNDLTIIEEKLIREKDTINNGYNCVYNNATHNNYELTDNQKSKISKRFSIPVLAIDRFTGKISNRFESISMAAKHYNTSTTNISGVCSGRLNYIKDMIFKYEKDYNGEIFIYDKHHNKGIPKSDDIKHKMAIANSRSITIIQYDINMVYVKEYISRNQCIKETGFGDYQIRKAIINKTPCNGYYFIQNNKI